MMGIDDDEVTTKKQRAKIKIVSYKRSGKYYSEKESVLKLEHERLAGFELTELLDSLSAPVKEYFGVLHPDGFDNVIEVEYPDGVRNFCNFMRRATSED
jgi:hypothetical protein